MAQVILAGHEDTEKVMLSPSTSASQLLASMTLAVSSLVLYGVPVMVMVGAVLPAALMLTLNVLLVCPPWLSSACTSTLTVAPAFETPPNVMVEPEREHDKPVPQLICE